MSHVVGEGIARRQADLGEIGEDEVAALGPRVGEVQLVQDGAEARDLAAHGGDRLGPEVVGLGLLEADGGRFLERRDGAVADAGVGRGHVSDQLGGPDEVADAPAGGEEVFAHASDGEGAVGEGGGEGGDAGEGDVVEAVVDFIGEDEDVVLEAEGADGA